MMELKEKYKNILTHIFIVVVIVGVIIFLILGSKWTIEERTYEAECCEKVCNSIGPGVVCADRQIVNSEIRCKYNYASRGRPEITEIFEFQLVNESFCEVQDGKSEDSQEFENTEFADVS